MYFIFKVVGVATNIHYFCARKNKNNYLNKKKYNFLIFIKFKIIYQLNINNSKLLLLFFKINFQVQLPSKIVVYESSLIQTSEMHYRIKEKISDNVVCNLLVVCSNNLVLCQVRINKLLCKRKLM